MLLERITWFMIVAVSIGYMAQRRVAEKPKHVPLVAQDEVDPRRWRHDGTQPVAWVNDGNRRQNASTFVTERELLTALG